MMCSEQRLAREDAVLVQLRLQAHHCLHVFLHFFRNPISAVPLSAVAGTSLRRPPPRLPECAGAWCGDGWAHWCPQCETKGSTLKTVSLFLCATPEGDSPGFLCFCFFWLSTEFPGIETPLCSCSPGSGLGRCDLSVLLGGTQVYCVHAGLEAPRSGVLVVVEPLGFHLQMRTTWPAARVRWKPDGRSQEGVGAA